MQKLGKERAINEMQHSGSKAVSRSVRNLGSLGLALFVIPIAAASLVFFDFSVIESTTKLSEYLSKWPLIKSRFEPFDVLHRYGDLGNQLIFYYLSLLLSCLGFVATLVVITVPGFARRSIKARIGNAVWFVGCIALAVLALTLLTPLDDYPMESVFSRELLFEAVIPEIIISYFGFFTISSMVAATVAVVISIFCGNDVKREGGNG